MAVKAYKPGLIGDISHELRRGDGVSTPPLLRRWRPVFREKKDKTNI